MINATTSLGQLVISLVSGAVYYVLGLLTLFIPRVLNYFKRKRNWFTPEFDATKGKFFYMITSSIEGEHPDGSTSKKGEIGDFRAYDELVAYHQFCRRPYTVDSIGSQLLDYPTHENIISIGGESGNHVTKMLLGRCECPFRFQEYSLEDTLTKEKYLAVLDTVQNNRVKKDYALIVKSPNPNNDENKIYVIAGIHSEGTFGAARCTHKDYKHLVNKVAKGKSVFAILLEVDVDYLKDEQDVNPVSVVKAYYSRKTKPYKWVEIEICH
jgi:hypothetical protein